MMQPAKQSGKWVVSRRVLLRSAVAGALASLSCVPGRLSPRSRRPVRFGIVTDCHYADAEPQGTRFYRESLGKLAECVERMSTEKVDFLIELGDFKDQNQPAVEDRTLGHLQSIEAVFRRFQGRRFHVLGNHDMDSISKPQFLSHVENTGIEAGRSYYSFDSGGLHFVVLDATYRPDGSDYDHGNFDWTSASIPARELDWLRQDLATSSGGVVVFVHQRLDGEGLVFVKNAPQVRQILQASNHVLAVFQGHDHDGDYRLLDGIPYYTLKAVVEGHGPDDNSYALVEVHPDHSLTVTGYHKASSMRLSHVGAT
jgi:predicted phosphodiesterase